MKNKTLILISWLSNPKSDWYPWLKKKLEKKGYEVYLPDLPTIRTNLPSLKKMLNKVDKTLKVDENTTVVGHSLGCLLALRLAERKSYKKMILLAGWDFDDLTKEHKLFWPNKLNHAKIKKNVKEIICFSSDNDPYITAFQVEEMSKRLKGEFVLVKGKGHFSAEKDKVTKIPEILQYL